MKTCSICGEIKPKIEFSKDRSNKDGLEYRCRDCNKARYKKYQQTESCKAKTKKATWKKLGIDITYDEYQVMLKDQKNCCAICEINITDSGWLCVDHDHSTGKIRKLLCGPCNLGLGNFKDNENFLMNAIKYLKDHK